MRKKKSTSLINFIVKAHTVVITLLKVRGEVHFKLVRCIT